jgi:hypothetical protein
MEFSLLVKHVVYVTLEFIVKDQPQTELAFGRDTGEKILVISSKWVPLAIIASLELAAWTVQLALVIM